MKKLNFVLNGGLVGFVLSIIIIAFIFVSFYTSFLESFAFFLTLFIVSLPNFWLEYLFPILSICNGEECFGIFFYYSIVPFIIELSLLGLFVSWLIKKYKNAKK